MDENLPMLPNGWIWTTLGEIIEEVEKINPKDDPNTEFLYLDIASIDNKQQTIIEPKVYLGKDAPSRARQLVKSGDILFSTVRTYLRNIALVEERYSGQIASTGFCVIRPFNLVNRRYVYYLVQTDSFLNPLTHMQRGTSYPAVRNSDVLSRIIPLPPLQEQQRIVTKIEELFTNLDAGISALTQTKKQLKNYRQSLLKYAFEGKLTEEWRKTHEDELEPASVLLEKIKEEQKNNEKGKKRIYKENSVDDSKLYELPEGWVWIYFNEIIHKSQNGFSKRFSDIGILTPVIRLANIHNHKINAEDIRSIKMSKNEREKYLLKKKDILLIRVNGTKELVGSANMFNLDGDFAFCDHFIRYSLWKDYIIVKYISSYLNTKFIRKYINSRIVSTAGQNTINQKNFGNLPIPLPPFLEQKQIMEILEQKFSIIDELEKITEINLMKAKRLRQSILKKAFKGSLVPQDTTDEPAHLLLERIKAQKDKEKNNKRKSKKNRTDSNQTRLIDYDK